MNYIETIEKILNINAIKEFLPMQEGDVRATEAKTKNLEDWIDFRPNTLLNTESESLFLGTEIFTMSDIARSFPIKEKCKITIIGLGYVGLPIVSRNIKNKKLLKNRKKLDRQVIGFDIDQSRINELNEGFDRTNEISNEVFKECNKLIFTTSELEIFDSDVFIITVPTPIDHANNPDLAAIRSASKLVGSLLRKKNERNKDKNLSLIIYESTVYPGLIEEICIPIIESNISGKVNYDFMWL